MANWVPKTERLRLTSLSSGGPASVHPHAADASCWAARVASELAACDWVQYEKREVARLVDVYSLVGRKYGKAQEEPVQGQ